MCLILIKLIHLGNFLLIKNIGKEFKIVHARVDMTQGTRLKSLWLLKAN